MTRSFTMSAGSTVKHAKSVVRRNEPCKDRRVRDWSHSRLGNREIELRRLLGQSIQVRTRRLVVAVSAQSVGARRIQGNHEQMRHIARIDRCLNWLFPASHHKDQKK